MLVEQLLDVVEVVGVAGVGDLDAAVKHLNDHDIPVEPIRVDEYTGKRFTFFADPDDLPLELYAD